MQIIVPESDIPETCRECWRIDDWGTCEQQCGSRRYVYDSGATKRDERCPMVVSTRCDRYSK